MNFTRLLADFVTVFAVTFLVSVMVTLLWNLIVYRAPVVDWETSFRLAVIFGVLLTWVETCSSKGGKL